MLSIRKIFPAMVLALVQEYNAQRATIAVSGSKYHKAVTSNPTTGEIGAPTSTPLLITSPDATTTATGKALANELLAKLQVHLLDPLAHKAADTVNAAALALIAAATDASTEIAAATAIQTAWNSHDGDTTFHYTADTTDDGTTITIESSAWTSLNAVKAALNAHVISSPAGKYISLVAP